MPGSDPGAAGDPSPRAAADSSPRAAADLSLLRAHEPIVHFARGELFFPTDVEPYVAHCSLWVSEGGESRCLVQAGELNPERLVAEAARHQGLPLSLRFVAQPLRGTEYRRWRRARYERIATGARFTTTGMVGRLIEVALRGSLLLRGTVARGWAAAAEIAYRESLRSDRVTYYGRVVRTGGYVCLQYWYFYAMNDWRSTFNGVNDHEADWEMVTVYLVQAEGEPPRPEWVAYSSHDHTGDELRRRWDDPDLRRDGPHPVLFPGAGSHSGAFIPGDYVITVNPPQLRTAIAAVRRAQRLLAPWRTETRAGVGLGVPFVDYARGDGRRVGPGEWTSRLIDDATPWVRDFRGLWGLDTEDPFGGERAPAGPRYERDGTVRAAWNDPVGWSGLLKVAPDDGASVELLRGTVDELRERLRTAETRIAQRRDALRRLSVEIRSLEVHHVAAPLVRARRAESAELESELKREIADRSRMSEELRAHLDTLDNPPQPPAPQAHLPSRPLPRGDEQRQRVRVLRVWATISTPLLLAAVPVILLARPLAWVTTLVVLFVLFVGIEAFARRRLLSFLASSLMVLVAIAVLVTIVELAQSHWRLAISVIFAAAAVVVLAGNLADLAYGWRRGGELGGEDDD